MSQIIDNDNSFVVDLLITLHNEKFSPLAWLRFVARSWEMSYSTASANPTLKRSWAHMTLFIGIVTTTILLITHIPQFGTDFFGIS